MGCIIVALPKGQDAKNISDILRRGGLETSAICTKGAGILSKVNTLEYGVVICTKQYSDMHYTYINEYLPKNFKMILLASPSLIATCPQNVEVLPMPFKPLELCNLVERVLDSQARKFKKTNTLPKKRNEAEQAYINSAKELLMKQKNMSEQEAFRYIQKCSMDSATNMVEMAQMIISMRGIKT